MPRKPKPTSAELQAQLTTVQADLASANLLKDKVTGVAQETIMAQQPTIDTFLKSTNETKLEDVTASNYSDVYDAEYKKVKDIRFTMGSDANADNAFYLYNAAADAEKKTDAVLANETKKKEDYAAQQDRLKKYIEGVQNTSQQKAFNSYLQSVLEKDYPDINQGFISSSSPLFNMAAFQKAKSGDKETKIVWETNAKGTRSPRTIYLYKDEAASKMQLDTVTSLYQEKFNNDAALQKTWVSEYTQSLNQQQRRIQKDLNKLNKPKK
jgi:hypothetical protein